MNSVITITSSSGILEFYPSNSGHTDQLISDWTEIELNPNNLNKVVGLTSSRTWNCLFASSVVKEGTHLPLDG
jgi:hypothetical protein